MAKPKSSASLAFRLNARLFFRQLLTFILLDLLLCLLFFGAGIYLTDRRCLELSRALNQSVPREEAETVPSLSLEGLSAEYQRELPEGKGEAAEGIHQRPGARIPGLLQKMQQTVTGLWRAIIGIERQRP